MGQEGQALNGKRSSRNMMKPILMVLLFISAGLAGCFADEEETTTKVEAIFEYDPKKDIRTGTTITFDASSSLPSDGSLTYKWDFDGDGDYDETGREADWEYPNAGTFEVELTVSDGTSSNSQTRTVKVAEADTPEPEADAGSDSPSNDCEGESASSGSFYLVYICEMDKSLSSKNILASTSVYLDGSGSEPCKDNPQDCDEYISEWYWDLDLQKDEDGDGDSKNDPDLEGESVEWKDVAPGKYLIALTVVSGQGLTSTDETTVYVNYAGRWTDISIGGNTSGSAVEIDFTFDVVYNEESGNRIKRVTSDLVYPQEDDDCVDTIPGEESNCRAKIDLFSYNSTDDASQDTSAIAVNQRQYGDCEEDNDCVTLSLMGSCHFNDNPSANEDDICYRKDGQWTIAIHNEMVNDLQVESLTIFLIYK